MQVKLCANLSTFGHIQTLCDFMLNDSNHTIVWTKHFHNNIGLRIAASAFFSKIGGPSQAWIRACMHTCMCVCYVYMYMCILCIYIHTKHIYIYICVYLYMYMHTYTNACIRRWMTSVLVLFLQILVVTAVEARVQQYAEGVQLYFVPWVWNAGFVCQRCRQSLWQIRSRCLKVAQA